MRETFMRETFMASHFEKGIFLIFPTLKKGDKGGFLKYLEKFNFSKKYYFRLF